MSEVKTVEEFVNEYLEKPLESYGKKQISQCVQDFLVQKGYGKTQVQATVEYVTHTGYGANLEQFVIKEGNSKFAAKLASINVAKTYSYYAQISSIAKPVESLYENLSKLESCKTEEGNYTKAGQELLETSLYSFLDISGKLVNYTPGGFLYTKTISEMVPIIKNGVAVIKSETNEIAFNSFMSENIDYCIKSVNALANGDWENGPTLEELEEIYNNCSGTEIFDEYLEWRIQYEFEQELIKNGVDIEDYYEMMAELNAEPPFWEKARDFIGDLIEEVNDYWETFVEAMHKKYDCSEPIDKTDEIIENMKKISKIVDTAEKTRYDPLIFDLDGDGYNVEKKELGANFDLDKNGFAEKINWTKKDGFLCLDLNGNGTVDDGGELFGDQTLLADGTRAKNGFEALAQYDSNGDGVIDAGDEIFDRKKRLIFAAAFYIYNILCLVFDKLSHIIHSCFLIFKEHGCIHSSDSENLFGRCMMRKGNDLISSRENDIMFAYDRSAAY